MTSSIHRLRRSIANTLSAIKAYDLASVCVSLGLAPEKKDENGPGSGKFRYVDRRLPQDEQELLRLGEKVLSRYPSFILEESIAIVNDEQGFRKTSEITRRNLLRIVASLGAIEGTLGIIEFLNRVWPLKQLPSVASSRTVADLFLNPTIESVFSPFQSLEDDVLRHMVNNPGDWTYEYLFDCLGVLEGSESRFLRFMEAMVDPLIRRGEEQERWVKEINQLLSRDGWELRAVSEVSGYPIFRALLIARGVQGQPKNLIFAANGPKPELVLKDAINNDVQIVKNAELCLIYDRTIGPTGLLWKDLVEWWAAREGTSPNDKSTEKSLYKRLQESLTSPPEQLLFRSYYKAFGPTLKQSLPVLIPQVYLHYDPYTARELGESRLVRQRMDFLLLFSSYERIVLEVDGKQHYAVGDAASPVFYARMVAEDRRIRLAGYEVYRFGGLELEGDSGEELVKAFFDELLRKHKVHT